jgi:DNA-binding NtrC family response regulator
MGAVLVVDSRGEVMRSVTDAVGEQCRHRIVARTTAAAAIAAVAEGLPIDVAVIDDRIAGTEITEFLSVLGKLTPAIPVVLLSSRPSVELYLKAMHSGVFDYLAQPVEPAVLRRVLTAATQGPGGIPSLIRRGSEVRAAAIMPAERTLRDLS